MPFKFSNTAVIFLFSGFQHTRAAQALSSMLSRGTLNPADIVVLHKLYLQPDPPPVDLIRLPQFLEMLIDALFKPNSKINQVRIKSLGVTERRFGQMQLQNQPQ